MSTSATRRKSAQLVVTGQWCGKVGTAMASWRPPTAAAVIHVQISATSSLDIEPSTGVDQKKRKMGSKTDMFPKTTTYVGKGSPQTNGIARIFCNSRVLRDCLSNRRAKKKIGNR